MKLTDKTVERLKHAGTKKDGSPKKTPDKYLDSDCPGLMIVVRASGKKTWVLRQKVNGRTVESKLGDFGRPDAGAMNCKLARKEFFKLQHVVNDGVTEHVAKRKRERVTGTMTLEEMMVTFRDHYGVPVLGWTWGTLANVDNRIFNIRKTRFKSLPVSTMTKNDASSLFKHLREKRNFSKARLKKMFQALSRAYVYATDEDLIDGAGVNIFDWCLRMRVKKLPNEKDYRDHVMSDREIRLLWNFKPFQGSRYSNGERIPGGKSEDKVRCLEARTIYKLLLMTGIRANEIRNTKWTDWEHAEVVRHPDTNRKIKIPMLQVREHKTAKKTHQPLFVPLAQPVIDLLLEYQEERRSSSVYVFPELTAGSFQDIRARNGAIAITHQISRVLNPREGTKFRLHDVRRTVASKMGDLGYTSDLIRKILNHSSDKQTTTGKHYNHSQYLVQKIEMYSAWLQELNKIINDAEEDVLDVCTNQFSRRRFTTPIEAEVQRNRKLK